MNNGRLLSVQNGNYLGTVPPYGYNKIKVKEGKRTCHTLEPNPDEAPIVKLIFEMYRDGYGSHTIARKLNEMGVPAPKGPEWSPESLKKLRCNEHYRGMVRWNYRRTVKAIEDGEVVTSRPLHNEYLLYPGKHPAIIDQELWDAVQEIRDKIPPVKGRAKHANPFAGIVYCQCGRPMSRRTYMRNGEERAPARLLCDGQTKCGMASCFVDEMKAEVIKVLKDAIADFDLRIKNGATDSQTLHLQLIQQLEKRVEELNKLELSQWDAYTKEGMPKHIFDQLNQKVLQERDEVQQALCTAKDSVPEPVNYELKRQTFHRALELLQDPDAPVREQNVMLKRCIDRIVYSRTRKPGGNRRWGEPEPMKLDVHLTV
jgi:hypothetical protein